MPRKKPTPRERLAEYQRKRSTDATPEPTGSTHSGGWGEPLEAPVSRPRVFCVQKHAARNTHYDLRLEWGGVLLSFAVPRGPTLDPEESRLAVQTEDHPLEYAEFEGVIPEGNYGAGAMIVWDKGAWVPLDDVEEGLASGKLHFTLHGYKLHGEFYMVKTAKQRGGREWLLKKKDDTFARTGGTAMEETSILSGLTVEELGQGSTRRAEILDVLAETKAPRRRVDPVKLKLMLAEIRDTPFTSDEWLFELKYDGYRVVLARRGEAPYVRSRNGVDMTRIFPDVSRALKALPYGDLVLDGELVVLDDDGRPNFGRLQRRSQIRRALDIARGTLDHPATVFVFDLLGFEGHDLRPLPLCLRKELLAKVLPRAGPLRFTEHIEAQGRAMYEHVARMGLEGIVAKKADAPYEGGRSSRLLKMPVSASDDFVVIGFTEPGGGRPGFGALHLGAYEDGELLYVGRAGSGFSDEQLTEYRAVLERVRTDACPVAGGPAMSQSVWGRSTPAAHVWVQPRYVAEVKYKTWTHDGFLRAPVFVRLRDDKDPTECVVPPGRAEALARGAGPAGVSEPDVAAGAEVGPSIDEEEPAQEQPLSQREDALPTTPKVTEAKTFEITNRDKVFWPEEGYTKGDLLDYYASVSEHLLPYLADRPLVLTRYPDGIAGKSFYQKNVPGFTPSWVRTIGIYSDHTEKEIEYYVCDDLETLLYVVQSGAIPLHIWPSRASTLQHPDFCLIDLDPKDAPFAFVVKLAKAIHSLCEEIGMPSYVKTTGSSGLHILLPLGRKCTFEQSRMLGQLIAHHVEVTHRDMATTQRTISARQGKVYVDFLQNRHGQLLVSPYSVRPIPGAPVSAPLEWREVNARLTPRKWTIANLPARLKRKKSDPNLPALEEAPDLLAVLERLAAIVDR